MGGLKMHLVDAPDNSIREHDPLDAVVRAVINGLLDVGVLQRRPDPLVPALRDWLNRWTRGGGLAVR
jgi:hypothetical protein